MPTLSRVVPLDKGKKKEDQSTKFRPVTFQIHFLKFMKELQMTGYRGLARI